MQYKGNGKVQPRHGQGVNRTLRYSSSVIGSETKPLPNQLIPFLLQGTTAPWLVSYSSLVTEAVGVRIKLLFM